MGWWLIGFTLFALWSSFPTLHTFQRPFLFREIYLSSMVSTALAAVVVSGPDADSIILIWSSGAPFRGF